MVQYKNYQQIIIGKLRARVSDECKGWGGGGQPLKPLTEPVKRILTDVIYLAPINITHYTKGRMFHKSQGGKKAHNNVWIDYLKFYSALLKI